MREKIINSAEFKALVRAKKTISLTLASIEVFIYFGFIWLIAYKKELIAEKILGSINLGIVIGIGVIFLSWILTGIYVVWVNRIYDEKMKNLKRKVEEGEI